ncbi:MAG: hypothetical protein KGI70_02045 [Patescibacteria group bacterium]|nr:hypothetical protein [Patescibacteria group bacterium]
MKIFLTMHIRPLAILYVLAVGALVPALASAATTSYSANWAGYAAQGAAHSYSGVSGSWVVPTVDSAEQRSAADTTWVGIGGLGVSDLIQAGTQATVQNGTVYYQAWIETLPQFLKVVPLRIHAGDSVIVSLTETSPDVWQAYFLDNTTGEHYLTAVNYRSSHASAEWIEEMPLNGQTGQYFPLNNFGTVSFGGGMVRINGSWVGLPQSGAQPLTMLSGNTILARPGALSADGSFSVVRTNTLATIASGNTTQTVTISGTRSGQLSRTIRIAHAARHGWRIIVLR